MKAGVVLQKTSLVIGAFEVVSALSELFSGDSNDYLGPTLALVGSILFLFLELTRIDELMNVMRHRLLIKRMMFDLFFTFMMFNTNSLLPLVTLISAVTCPFFIYFAGDKFNEDDVDVIFDVTPLKERIWNGKPVIGKGAATVVDQIRDFLVNVFQNLRNIGANLCCFAFPEYVQYKNGVLTDQSKTTEIR